MPISWDAFPIKWCSTFLDGLAHPDWDQCPNHQRGLVYWLPPLWWFSVGRFKYKPGHKPCDLLKIRVLSLVENLFKKESFTRFALSRNAVISTNERNWIITGHVIFNGAYNEIFQLKTTINWMSKMDFSLCSNFFTYFWWSRWCEWRYIPTIKGLKIGTLEYPATAFSLFFFFS